MLRIDSVEGPSPFPSAWPLVAGLPHLPATAGPDGRTRNGLPIGVQVIDPFLEDLTTIAFAGEIAAAFGLSAEIASAKPS